MDRTFKWLMLAIVVAFPAAAANGQEAVPVDEKPDPLTAARLNPIAITYGHNRDVPLAAGAIGCADFTFSDWDGDGDLDLFVTNGGSIDVVENVGTRTAPRFVNTFKSVKPAVKDSRIGRFFSTMRRPGIGGSDAKLPTFISFTANTKVGDIGKIDLFLNLYQPTRGAKGKVEWKISPALGSDREPLKGFSDTWMCPAMDTADFNGDGKDDVVYGLSHPWRTLPSGQFAAGYNTPAGDWKLDQCRVYVMLNDSKGDKLMFGAPQEVAADGKPIAPFGNLYPIAKDIDGDGLIDLVVGQHKPGLLYFRNIGTKTEPKFAAAVEIADENGAPYHSMFTIHPRFADLDGDGRDEMINTTYFGCVHHLVVYKQLEGNGGVRWKRQGDLMMVGGKDTPVMPQGIATIEPVDWNGDGNTDLLVGSEPCAPGILINEGTNAAPVWKPVEPLKWIDGTTLEYFSIEYGLGSVWGPGEWYMERVQTRLRDWDGDGVRDLLTGSMGERQLMLKGKMIDGELRFEKPVAFTVDGVPLMAAHRVEPAILDFNGDGHADLMALDDQNVVKVWPGDGTAALGKPQTYLGADGKPLQLKTRILDLGHGRCALDAVDWDLDGKMDFILYLAFDRKRGGVYYYHASATPLQFDEPVKFCSYLSFHNGGIGLGDWDGDGLLDIFTGGDRSLIAPNSKPYGNIFVIPGKNLPVPPAKRECVVMRPTIEKSK